MSIIVVYDTEFTSWEGARDCAWALPGQYREVTQIGAVRYDMIAEKVIDRFNVLVHPIVNPVISKYHAHLTGTTQSDIDRAEAFTTIYPRFVDWVGGDVALAYGWDALVIGETAILQGLDCALTLDDHPLWFDLSKQDGAWPPCVPLNYRQQPADARAVKRYGESRMREVDFSPNPDSFFNVDIDGKILKTKNLRLWFQARGVPIDDYSSGQLHEYLGIPLDGHIHDALFDAMSLAVSYTAMNKR